MGWAEDVLTQENWSDIELGDMVGRGAPTLKSTVRLFFAVGHKTTPTETTEGL